MQLQFLGRRGVFENSLMRQQLMSPIATTTKMKNAIKEYSTLFWSIFILLDGILDIIVTALYYQRDKIAFFVLSLCIIFIATIINATNLTAFITPATTGDKIYGSKSMVIFCICFMPFTVSLPLVAYIISNNDFIQQKLESVGCTFGDIKFDMGITFDLDQETFNTFSVLFQSLPMAMLQMIYILNISSFKSVTDIILIISLISSVSLVLLRSFSFSKSKKLHLLSNEYIYPRLCVAVDLFSLYQTIYLFHPSYSQNIMMIWFYSFIIGILSLTVIYSIYILLRLCYIYFKDFSIAMKHDHGELRNYFYRCPVEWQPYYDDDRDWNGVNMKANKKQWFLYYLFCIAFIIVALFFAMIILIVSTFLMEFLCFTYIPLLFNHLIAKYFIDEKESDNDTKNEWDSIFQFIENSMDSGDMKLRLLCCYQILQKDPVTNIPIDKGKIFEQLEIEEERVMKYQESDPFCDFQKDVAKVIEEFVGRDLDS